MEKIRIGTRGSALALAQAEQAKRLVLENFPEVDVEICVIKTVGDKDHVRSLVSFGGQGVFVKEIEEALLEGNIDLAVHSLKDVPDSMDPRLELSGFLKRENPRDVLVSNGISFGNLRVGATIGTGSPRRVLQLKAMRPDIRCENLRGNLPSRIERVKSGELDAIMLGAAGLVRLGLSSEISDAFSVIDMTPAIGQGIVAIQSLRENAFARSVSERISDKLTVIAARAERRWMELLGGGCRVPMGAILEPEDDGFCFTAFLADAESGRSVRLSKRFFLEEVSKESGLEKFAREFAAECHRKKIPLPSETSGTEAIASFWNREH